MFTYSQLQDRERTPTTLGKPRPDWEAQTSLVDDVAIVPLPQEQKRRVQIQCVKAADYDRAQAEEFMMALGVHPSQSDLIENSSRISPNVSDPQLSMTSKNNYQRSPGRIDRVDPL